MLQNLSDIWDGRSVPQTSPYLDDNDSLSMLAQSLVRYHVGPRRGNGGPVFTRRFKDLREALQLLIYGGSWESESVCVRNPMLRTFERAVWGTKHRRAQQDVSSKIRLGSSPCHPLAHPRFHQVARTNHELQYGLQYPRHCCCKRFVMSLLLGRTVRATPHRPQQYVAQPLTPLIFMRLLLLVFEESRC